MTGLHNPPLGESDTRSKLIDPAIHARGWTEEHIRREETAGAIEIIDGKPRRRSKGRVDYTLREKVSSGDQPVALGVIEAKAEKNGEPKRALLSLATGAGKTFIAVQLLRRVTDAGKMGRALFVCDRDELRTQALGALQNEFGNDVAAVSTRDPQKNARIVVATYQTLGVDSDESDANFLLTHCPENFFTHIVIDECHRSAWGKWSQVLTRNPAAVQVPDFRDLWIVRNNRLALFGRLPDAGRSPLLVRALEQMDDFDLYDVLADLGYGLDPKTRIDRAEAFLYKHSAWLGGLPTPAALTLEAIVGQFSKAGADGLESPDIFNTPEVRKAGGRDGPIKALRELGKPADVLLDTKARLFAA